MTAHSRTLILALTAASWSAACYAYLPPSPAPHPLVGHEVQATLTDSGAVVLAARIGPAVDQLRGRVIAEQPGVLTLSMDEAVMRDGNGITWKHEALDVPRPLIDKVEVKEFSPSRTVLFSGLLSVALVAVERGFLHSGGANAPGTAQTGTPGAK